MHSPARWIVGAAVSGLVLAVAGQVGAVAAPAAVQAMDDFTPSPGTWTANTDALTITGPGDTVVGTNRDGIAVFQFGDVTVGSDVVINAVGSRPLEISASGVMTVAGTVSASGGSAVDFGSAATAPGAGGAAGGLSRAAGSGPGAGQPGSKFGSSGNMGGGGGGGYGGQGARGGSDSASNPAGAGGPAYGDLNALLQGGSGGGGGDGVAGGAGGGALRLVAGSLTVAPTGTVLADGGGGAVGGFSASGGGSGGALVLRADSVDLEGLVAARGGPGGRGGCCPDGGGGGGGRIALQYGHHLTLGTPPSVAGGTSGFRSTTGCCSSGTFHSVDMTGANGVLLTQRNLTFALGGPRKVGYGKAATLAVTVTDLEQSTPVANAPVSLVRVDPGGTTSEVAGTTTDSSGRAIAAVSPLQNTTYQWQFAGDGTHSPGSSAARVLTVVQGVTLKVTDRTPRAGRTVKLYGVVTPSSAGQDVWLQRKQGTRWVDVTSARIKSQAMPTGGTVVGYVFKQAFARGKVVVRVRKPATSTLAQGLSPSLTLAVG